MPPGHPYSKTPPRGAVPTDPSATVPTGPDAGDDAGRVMQRVIETVGPQKASRWFGPQTRFEYRPDRSGVAAGGTLVVRAATPYLLKFVLSQYREVIRDAAEACGYEAVAVDGVVDESLASGPREAAAGTPAADADAGPGVTRKRHSPASPQPVVVSDNRSVKPVYDLDEFVVGDCNRLGYCAARQFIEDPGLAFGPLMFVGGVGVGKTHLLAGLAAAVKAGGRRRVLMMTAVDFCNRFKQAMYEQSTAAFRQKFHSVDVLCLDDVDFFDGTRAFQTELLQTIERLERRGVRFVMTCGVNPQTLTKLSEELVSRLLSGVVCRVERPSQSVRRRVAAEHARRLEADLSGEAIRHAADRCVDSIRRVRGAIQTLHAEARMLGRKVGVSHARTVLARLQEGTRSVVRLADIDVAVARLFDVSADELKSSARVRRVSRPRHIAMALARRLTTAAYQEIGHHFGGRNHSTVIAAEKAVARLLDTQETFRVGSREMTAGDVLHQLEGELRAG